MTVRGSALAAGRIAWALHDLADPARRTRLRDAEGRPTLAGLLALAREAAQGVLLLGRGPRAHAIGAAVDAAHAITMIGYAIVRPARGGAAEAGRGMLLAVAEWTVGR